MTVRAFILTSVTAAAIGWTAWGLIIASLDPRQAGLLGYILFFLALFLGVAASVSLGGYAVRRILQPRRLAFYAIRPAVRQGILLALFMNIVLLLQLGRLYRWWVGIILTGIVVITELVFLSYDLAHRRTQPR
ncbi:MAG: hypothetical protein COT71_03150 [Candidatus Andersenbacteria bacterium CG10_big_fil_rev_8_21_14_0_10_54_11]|uniref:Uncharacterized protein n=1 Tax=Candidatus Andersenbacteria bacterium CG10_big_fil_rev_8_21_14_0_10_54_11 TaxID=1974485 RepID=A0A2M6WYY9_9BACT|nr:MAG: hypothetical protein COT71_03150 [Candidatus Andersenbacteria bacterium CG10_big_fil_rev_8_21_14_0_10_54_11]